MVEVRKDAVELKAASRDMSLFEVMPAGVAYPRNPDELSELVRAVGAERKRGVQTSITARSAGTDMGGGPLNSGIIAVFTKYMNKMGDVALDEERVLRQEPQDFVTAGFAVTQPGVYYRDFEKATLAKGLILPSYPASREICAMGGIVANNAAGERTLEYGKTEKYLEELAIVLSDGSQATFKALSPEEVEMKKGQKNLEGEIYREMDALLTKNAKLIEAHRPKVSKNSAGYALWNIRDPRTGATNLAKLICGSQGTLALWTRAKLRLVKPKEHRAMLVIFLQDLNLLPLIVERILPLGPESFESYDDHTFTLAVKFLPEMLAEMGFAKAARLGIDFIPEAEVVLAGGVPKMLLMAEFAENSIEDADKKAASAQSALADLHIKTKIEKNERESEKFWIVRRESFRLLRKNLHGLIAAPFIDDFVVPPASYAQFLPELNALLAKYSDKFIYTIAGHVGNGNFHIIPLMDLGKPAVRRVILELAPLVYALVIKYGGTTTGEHNDGIIRTPYLPLLFGPEMIALFAETKKIFDPLGIFNPGKKVGGTFADIERNMIR
ncbi:FAD-binding oxidoreductase [Candidatus Kaiserbacteria bacterium]|nr:FAD-binding oxidoreductase [Candidatus Kaiserbacteria bacterium]